MRTWLTLMAACIVCSVASAQTGYGAWTVLDADGSSPPMIYTTNDSGTVFGQACDAEADTCYWIVAQPTSCIDKVETPAIVNTGPGASAIKMFCSGQIQIGGRPFYRYVVYPFDLLTASVTSTDKLSIAFPIEGDSFRVLRFSMYGAVLANKRMDSEKEKYWDRKRKSSTKDLKL